MRLSRIFQEKIFSVGEIARLDERASHYLASVLRLKEAAPLILFNGDGYDYPATIVHIEKKTVSVQVLSRAQVSRESPLAIHLYQGLCRGEKMDFVIQKAVELGVSAITPLLTEYVEVKLNAEKLEKRRQHWQAIIVSACEQSGRAVLPVLHAPRELFSLTDLENALVLHPSEEGAASIKQAKNISILVGPEGGFSEKEIQFLIKNKMNVYALGPRILRTETAALAMIASLQTRLGDFL